MVSIPYIQKHLNAHLPANSIRERFAKGTFWSFVGTVASQGLTLLSLVVAARILGKENFGKLGMLQSTVGMLGIFAGMGLGMTATKFVAEFRTKDPAKAGSIIGMSSFVAFLSGGAIVLVLFLASGYLASHTLNAPDLTTDLQIGCGLLFFNALNGAQTGAMTGLEAFKGIARINFIRGVLGFPIIIICVYVWGLTGAVAGLAAVSGLAWLVTHFVLRGEMKRQNIRYSLRGFAQELPVLWKFSLPAFLSSAVSGPANWATRMVLANQPNGYSGLGIFSAVQNVMAVMSIIPGLVSTVSLPILSGLYGSQDMDRYRKVLWKLIKYYAMVAFLATAIVCGFSSLIMAAFGTEFTGGWPVLCTFAVATCLSIISYPVGQAISSSGKMWWGAIFNGLWALVLIICALVLAPKYGAEGLAVAFLISYVCHTVWQGLYVYWKVYK